MKAVLRLADSSNDFVLKIFLAGEKINQFTGRFKRHGVDGKIPTRKIVFKFLPPLDFGRPAMIKIVKIAAKGVNFINGIRWVGQTNSAKVIVVEGLGKKFEDLLGAGVGGEVPVFDGIVKQKVANGAANNINFKPISDEGVKNLLNEERPSKAHGFIIQYLHALANLESGRKRGVDGTDFKEPRGKDGGGAGRVFASEEAGRVNGGRSGNCRKGNTKSKEEN